MTRLQLTLRAVFVMSLYLVTSTIDGGIDPAYIEPLEQEPPALCETDTDCARHCPPPADDDDCDGGPQGPEWLPRPIVYQV